MNFPALKFSAAMAAVMSVAVLAGCGGGGGGTGAMASSTLTSSSASTAFPIQKAMSNIYTNGYAKTFSVTGTAVTNGMSYPFTGTLQVTETLENANTTFNGQAAQEDAVSATGAVSIEGQTFNLGSVAQYNLFQTSSNVVLGITTPTAYCVEQSSSQFPASAVVGQTGTVASVTCYTDSTKTTVTGSETVSYAVTAGSSASTATVTLTFVTDNSSNQQIGSTQANYLIDTSGNFTVSSAIYNVSVGGVQVTFTAQ